MQTYYVDFVNRTDRTWHLAVYITLENSTRLESVVWRVTAVPPGGVSGVKWTMDYDAALADYHQEASQGVYRASQVLPTKLGAQWDIVFRDDVQQLVPAEPHEADPESFIFTNRSGLDATPGIGLSGQGAIFMHDVHNNATLQLKGALLYRAGLYREAQPGQPIDEEMAAASFPIAFTPPTNVATITATQEGDAPQHVIEYSIR